MRKRQRTRRQQRDGLILHSSFSISRHQRCCELHAQRQFTADSQAAGHEKNVVGMIAINNNIYCATNDNRLWWRRDPVGFDVNWQHIGHANNVVATAAINNKLFCATRDNKLWWRDPVDVKSATK